MRVALSTTLETFGPDAGVATDAGNPPPDLWASSGGMQAAASPDGDAADVLDRMFEAFPESARVESDRLDPALEAWLAPISGDGDAPSPAALFHGVVAPLAADPCHAAPLEPPVTRERLQRGARDAISGDGAPPVHVIAASNGFCDPEPGGGQVTLRFDPQYQSCDPVYLSLGRGAAHALALQILHQLEAAAGAPDASGALDDH